jgi:F-type H+-transporting ATPase subunit b
MSALLANTYFWQTLGTLLLVWLLFRFNVFQKIGGGLDKRAERISAELEEARRLRAEAEALLLEYERKRERAESEATEIVNAAREEAERISKEAEARLTDFIARRTASAEAKITQAEEQAMIEVRDAAIAAAVKASETVLRGSVQGPLGEDLIKQGLQDTRRTLS